MTSSIPVLRTIVGPVTIGVATIVVLEALGVPLSSMALVAGAVSFVLAFALQSTLEDVFGALSLLVDTPFAYGDVVRLQDGTICQVERVGVRVTKLYKASDHSVIAVPNRELAGQRITNLARPSPDLMLAINVEVDSSATGRVVRHRLIEAADSHPWVLGPAASKVAAIRRRIDRLALRGRYPVAARQVREMSRWAAEGEANMAIEALAGFLLELATLAHKEARGGFDRAELDSMDHGFQHLRDLIGQVRDTLTVWLLAVRHTYVEGRCGDIDNEVFSLLEGRLHQTSGFAPPWGPAVLDHAHEVVEATLRPIFERVREYDILTRSWVEGAGSSTPEDLAILGEMRTDEIPFVLMNQEGRFQQVGFGGGLANRSDHGIADLDEVEEYMTLVVEWNRKMKWLCDRVARLHRDLGRGAVARIDDDLYALRRWIASDFKESTPEWKYPSTSLVSFGQNFDYALKVYVDNVRLSHFTRASKTANQLRLEILHLFRRLTPTVELAVATDVMLHWPDDGVMAAAALSPEDGGLRASTPAT